MGYKINDFNEKYERKINSFCQKKKCNISCEWN